MKIRILLADDHPALLSGLKHDLSALPTLEIVGTAKNSGELIDLLNRASCDVLVTDYAMPGGTHGDGLAFVSYLRRNFPALKIVVFTMLDTPAIVQELAKLGVESVVGKTAEIKLLVSAIHAVYAGARYFPSEAGSAGRTSAPGAGSANHALSKRELEVVRLYVSGASINEIAEQLNRSKQTISTQKTSAMRKLGIERDADLFRFAYETGIAAASDGPSAKT